MYSPTTSPYGYSSFLKEESLVAFDTFFIFGITDFTFLYQSAFYQTASIL